MNMNIHNYFEFLELGPETGAETISKNAKRKAKIYARPDRGGRKNAISLESTTIE